MKKLSLIDFHKAMLYYNAKCTLFRGVIQSAVVDYIVTLLFFLFKVPSIFFPPSLPLLPALEN